MSLKHTDPDSQRVIQLRKIYAKFVDGEDVREHVVPLRRRPREALRSCSNVDPSPFS